MSGQRFSARAIGEIRETVRRVKQMPRQTSLDGIPAPALLTLRTYIMKTPVGGIAARSGTTPGSATCTYWTLAGGTLAEWDNTSGVAQTETVYNLSTTAVAAEAYIVACQELLSGKLLALWEDCT